MQEAQDECARLYERLKQLRTNLDDLRCDPVPWIHAKFVPPTTIEECKQLQRQLRTKVMNTSLAITKEKRSQQCRKLQGLPPVIPIIDNPKMVPTNSLNYPSSDSLVFSL